MNEREKIIQLWFEMWLTKQDLGIDNIFTEDVIYTESYRGFDLSCFAGGFIWMGIINFS